MVQERPVRVERRLSAILAADVAGYSRLMHRDEEATHAKPGAFLMKAVHPAIAEHGGCVVKNTGDGFLAELPSAVGAVRAAMQFQTRVHELTIDEAEDRIAFRVGNQCTHEVIIDLEGLIARPLSVAATRPAFAEPQPVSASFALGPGAAGSEGADRHS